MKNLYALRFASAETPCMTSLRMILMVIVGTLSTQAQTLTYAPFPDSAVVWREDLSGLAFNCCCSGTVCLFEDHYQIFSAGDTVVNNVTYMKIYQSGFNASFIGGPFTCPPWCTNYVPNYYSNLYLGGLRQDTAAKKVFLLTPGGLESLLYDFDLAPGDTLPLAYNNTIIGNFVSSIDSVLVGNQYHRRFWISDNNVTDYVSIIEGIGSTFGLMFPLYPPFEFFNTLSCVIINGQTVYPDTTTACPLISGINDIESDNTLSVLPNPFSDLAVVSGPALPDGAEGELYDLTGMPVLHFTLQKGSAVLQRGQIPSGMYLLRINSRAGQQYQTKVLIQ